MFQRWSLLALKAHDNVSLLQSKKSETWGLKQRKLYVSVLIDMFIATYRETRESRTSSRTDGT